MDGSSDSVVPRVRGAVSPSEGEMRAGNLATVASETARAAHRRARLWVGVTLQPTDPVRAKSSDQRCRRAGLLQRIAVWLPTNYQRKVDSGYFSNGQQLLSIKAEERIPDTYFPR